MAEFTEDFEGGADGVSPTAPGTTAFSGIAGSASTFTHSTLRSILGSTSMRIQNPTATAYLYQLFSPVRTVCFQRVYWYAADLTNGSPLMATQTTGTIQGNVQVIATGAIRLRDANTVVATSYLTASAGQWYRFELFADYVAGVQTLRVFLPGNLHGSVPDDEIHGALTVGSFNRAIIGTASAQTLDWFWDSYAEDQTDWIGPAAIPYTPVNGKLLLEDGSGHILLEDGSGALISEDYVAPSSVNVNDFFLVM